MSKNINTPPKYCKNATASKKGWHDPSSGELLVSNKSLDLELISKTNNVIRTSLVPSMAEKNDALIAEMFPVEILDDVLAETLLAGIKAVSTDVETNDKTEKEVFYVDVGDTEINKEIVADVMAKAHMVEQLHEEAGNSKTVFKDSDMNVNEDFMESLEKQEDIFDFDEMTNADLVKHANKIGAKVAKRDNKTTLIKKIEEHNA